MDKITTLFWDVGGVILSNAWDRKARRAAAKKFKLDWDEFEDRHELVNSAFDKGELGLDDYLEQTVFYCRRGYPKQLFKKFMYDQSKPDLKTLAILDRIASSHRYLIVMLNNESLELNEYRIRKFGLQKYFDVFLSSCYLGVRKPEKAIYRLALQITQTTPKETLLIDDRALNLEAARRSHINTLHFLNAGQLEKELRALGIA